MPRRYTKGSQDFVNPYHFVPLDTQCKRSSRSYRDAVAAPGSITGWIKCRLESKSPLFIPNSTNDDIFRERVGNDVVKSYEFYSYEDLRGRHLDAGTSKGPERPVIPGSEIRGMIRSAYEAVTASCMSSIDEDRDLYKRVTYPGKPGRIEKTEDGHWVIRECTRYGVGFRPSRGEPKPPCMEQVDQLREGQECWIVSSNTYTKRIRNSNILLFPLVDDLRTSCPSNGNWMHGYFHKGEPLENDRGFDRRHHESVFVPTEGGTLIFIDEGALVRYKKNVELYRDHKHNRFHVKNSPHRHRGYMHIDLDDLNGALVYYVERNGRYYLSPAAIGREVFSNKLTNLIKSFSPCEKLNSLCSACSLFGMVGDGEAAASRIRFTDAVYSPSGSTRDKFFDPVVLPELASPKLSASEFYLEKKEDAALWNYDYAGNWESGRGLPQLKALPDSNGKIRGRKFYWHKGISIPPQQPQGQVSERNVKVRPLRSEGKFDFKIFFNNIERTDLEKLLWVAEIGGTSSHGHKIGMGKPVGLGSVRIAVEEVVLRDVSLSEETLSYSMKRDDEILNSARGRGVCDEIKLTTFLGCSKEAIHAFLKLCTLKNDFSEEIDYPRMEQPFNVNHPDAAFHWFVGNKQIEGKGTKQIIDQSLPDIDNPRLKKIIVRNV